MKVLKVTLALAASLLAVPSIADDLATTKRKAFPITLPADINVNTAVDGSRFRVRVKGRIARVYGKSAIVRPTPETREAMRTAVQQATGCEIVDPYFIDAHLVGMLSCPRGGD